MIKVIIFIAKRFKPLDEFLSALLMALMAHNAKSISVSPGQKKQLLEEQAKEEIRKITAFEKNGEASGYEAPRIVGVRR